MKRFSAPKIFDHKRIESFLSTSAPIFRMGNTMTPDVTFDLSKVKKCSITGLLIIYKFIDYTYHNYCFKKPNISVSPYIEEAWERFQFTNLIKAYIDNNDKTEREYKKLKVKIEENFLIAPQALLRNTTYTYEKLRKEFLPQLERYYSDNEPATNMIFTCLSELLLNFWEHAKKDSRSIIIASGDSNKIEISCADTGDGIVSTLGKANVSKSLSPEKTLELSLVKGATSKKLSNHMGYGLWIINEIVNLTKSRLHIYSQGAFVKNDYGKIKSGKCGYWQGTIVTLILYLDDPKTIRDIPNHEDESLINGLKINFV
jgi:anti-sigma regulatory factor (Ser/Thr protein kinase)